MTPFSDKKLYNRGTEIPSHSGKDFRKPGANEKPKYRY